MSCIRLLADRVDVLSPLASGQPEPSGRGPGRGFEISRVVCAEAAHVKSGAGIASRVPSASVREGIVRADIERPGA